MSPGLLIVNADDLGRTLGINDGIFAAHAGGIVTSATLMVNFPASAEAADRLAGYPRLGVGLHVALTGGSPTLDPGRVPSLVDGYGRLPRKPDGLHDARAAEILAEVRAQVERFGRLVGRLPTHLDSHHHSHRLDPVCDALAEAAREHELPVRNAGPRVQSRLREAGVATTGCFVERFFGDDARLEVLVEELRAAGGRTGSTELMCHPGRVDRELRSGSSYVDERERELAALTHPDARRAIEEAGLRLIHFGELGG